MGRPVLHFEIGCRDKGRTAQFLGKPTPAKQPRKGQVVETRDSLARHILTRRESQVSVSISM